VAIVGVIPAAGYATRLQPRPESKEMLSVGGRPVMDYLVDRLRVAGCSELRVVTRPEKEDVIAHAKRLGAAVILGYPRTVSASFVAGMDDLSEQDIILIGFPDTLWEPEDGYRQLMRALEEGCDVALGLFKIDASDLRRSDVVVLGGQSGQIAGIDIKPTQPRSEWIWGCAAAHTRTLAGLHQTEWPGEYFDSLCRTGHDVRGIPLSDVWLDVGTEAALNRANSASSHTNPTAQ
jgi:glucose-1-phosphate thymidylyltransferase